MPEIRLNPITGDWVIIATERARRPEEFVKKEEKKTLPAYSPECPFCPGNEEKTPGETFRIHDGTSWQVRVVPNKFAALSRDGEPDHKAVGLRKSLNGVGVHEVIVETPQHHMTTALLPPDQVRRILQASLDRYRTIYQDPRVQQVILFKNHGEGAGTSLEHPHSQIVGTPVISSEIRLRFDRALRYMDEMGECLFCRVLTDELEEETRIVAQNSGYVAFVPYAALSPFHLWIFPRRHRSFFGGLEDLELEPLAELLRLTLAKLYYGLNNPDYNYVVRSVPAVDPKREYFHWYMSIVPRLSKAAGFELGSGMFINTALPEQSARLLRETQIPAQESGF
ncbi:MAG: galactose-1-phosphate uridylyltransferase [Candidatus Tectomicrobia bacterium]|uniref:Galactose-1-phosphate uridylyltransferase n=1 Tax=Tectimicrobiota bacterium TaxID=2528274 RepID=A0A932GP77_UNCTE|nr:galactose-1-phosphate uridylyltransferase [Candidatus Tectomicrobia bacterium]